jgi:phosphoribosylglycinamide formyltransferase 1
MILQLGDFLLREKQKRPFKRRRRMKRKVRIGALISGGGTNLQAIIDACESGRIDAEMAFVGSDNLLAKGLLRAEKHHIPAFVVDYADIIEQYREDPRSFPIPGDFDLHEVLTKQHFFPPDADSQKTAFFFNTRAMAEDLLIQKMSDHPYDLLVLAGFMRVLTPYFIDRVNDGFLVPRIMNIHPALLPAFPGEDGYGDTFRYGCKVGGCTVHFIDYGEDSGPIIGQKTFPILEEDTLDTVKEKGLNLEWELYPECIQLFAENRLRIEEMSFDMGGERVFRSTRVKILPAAS